MPSNNGICKSISGGLSAMQCCVILFTWLGAFSLLWDSAIAACGVPPNIDKADILSQSATDVRYKCKSGYEPGATKTMATCQGSNWVFAENRPLVCRRVSCGTPPDKQHASYKERSYLFGDNVYYVCDTGYKQVLGTPNYNVISCQPNGRWTMISFSCGPKTCPALSNPANGNVAIVQGANNEYNYGNIYRFTCNVGFMSKGRQTVDVTCTDAATWSEKDVKCEEGICPEPTTPENGIKLSTGNKYGDLREFKCKDKYEMVGQPKNTLTSVCQKDGKWSDPPPTCRLLPVPCNVPSGPKNGYAEMVNDNEYRMKCNPGYKLQSGNSYEIVTCQIDGTWSFNPAVCLVVSCGAPKIPTNGELVTNDDKKYTVRCKNGFKLVGGQVGETVSETCQNNGEWTQNNNPVCKGVTCGSPIIPNNGELVTTDTKTYTIRCKDGFRLELEGVTDNITVLCQNNGQWTPVNAVCTEETCKKKNPTAPANGKIEKVMKPETYKITCNKGYKIIGRDTVTCVNKLWSPTTTTCTKESAPGGFSRGEKIAIGIGTCIGALIIVGLVIFLIWRYCTVSCCTCNGKECCTCNKKPVEIEKDLTERKPFHTGETNTNTGTTSNSNC
ncbi:sushi, von Willebrand factor type A, EGF and pentraxin domain-containing protein 1-like isoform X2 [Lineus longissimus]|uniref:sushi, von Willebrand factor type A, EGF and pentraxin domain-containing protein 1-like isoform X2 n=1 Tax=Lineus longissimus TaxID=88925 RepID=UPI00315CDDCF